MFQSANLSDGAEYVCIVLDGNSDPIETKYTVRVQSKIMMMFYFLGYFNYIFR